MKKKGVLIVEDKKFLRIIMEEYVDLAFNYPSKKRQIYSAGNQEEAIDIYQKHHSEIGIIILDILLPDGDGEEVYFKIKEIDPDFKTFIISGYTDQQKIGVILKDNPKNLFKIKPISFTDFKTQIDRLIQK